MTNTMHANRIFNPKGTDDVAKRTIIKGDTTGLFNLNAVKYQWAKSLYQVMIGNFWVPEKVSGLKDDARMFHTDLSPEEQRLIAEAVHTSPGLRKVLGDLALYASEDSEDALLEESLKQVDPSILPPTTHGVVLEDTCKDDREAQALREDMEDLKRRHGGGE